MLNLYNLNTFGLFRWDNGDFTNELHNFTMLYMLSFVLKKIILKHSPGKKGFYQKLATREKNTS